MYHWPEYSKFPCATSKATETVTVVLSWTFMAAVLPVPYLRSIKVNSRPPARRRRRDPSPRNIYVAGAVTALSTEYPRGIRGGAATSRYPQNIHVASAAVPRPISSKYPPCARDVDAARAQAVAGRVRRRVGRAVLDRHDEVQNRAADIIVVGQTDFLVVVRRRSQAAKVVRTF